MASSQTSSSSTTWPVMSPIQLGSQDKHFELNWQSSLSFVETLDSGEEDVEVTKNITERNNFKFDPVVGGRNSTRSSSSRSSGSTGFYEAVELSPVNSMSPQHFEQQTQQDLDESTNLCQLMSNFYVNEPQQDNRLTFNQQTFKNLAALASLNAQNCSGIFEAPTSKNMSSMAVAKPPIQQQYLQQQNYSFESFPALTKTDQNPFVASNNSPIVSRDNVDDMHIRCKFGSLGQSRAQFHSPHGFCMGLNEEIIVADTYNHRIQIFNKEGQYINGFGIAGKEEGKLWYPRKIAVLKDSGNLVICDRGSERSRMQIFSPAGYFIRRIQIRFIDIVAGLAIDRHNRIVAVDSVTPTIFILSEDGNLLKFIECADYMSEPSDIAIFGQEYYICDFKGHGVVVIHENGELVRRIGRQPVTNFPNGIDISDAGDILVGDSHGNQFHVAIYDRLGDLVGQFQCPQVKVSRCCGLKITSEGYIVTLAKNNHHVLVLNTLFVP